MNKFMVLWSVMWAVVVLIAVVIIYNSFEVRAQKQADAAYKQGYKDALYKRPASDDLELVCAGLWLSQLKPGEQ